MEKGRPKSGDYPPEQAIGFARAVNQILEDRYLRKIAGKSKATDLDDPLDV